MHRVLACLGYQAGGWEEGLPAIYPITVYDHGRHSPTATGRRSPSPCGGLARTGCVVTVTTVRTAADLYYLPDTVFFLSNPDHKPETETKIIPRKPKPTILPVVPQQCVCPYIHWICPLAFADKNCTSPVPIAGLLTSGGSVDSITRSVSSTVLVCLDVSCVSP